MIRVSLLCEDRTGGGLAEVLQRAANAARSTAGKPPIAFGPAGTLLNNHELIRRCRAYDLLRFRTSPAADHVYYVVDAKRLWDLKFLHLTAPAPGESPLDFLRRAEEAACRAMIREARSDRGEEEWLTIATGFHPHVLLWERESLIVAVSDAVNLGPPDDADKVRNADAWVGQRFRQHRNAKYVKGRDGILLLREIAASAELRDRILHANASVRAIVDSMAAI